MMNALKYGIRAVIFILIVAGIILAFFMWMPAATPTGEFDVMPIVKEKKYQIFGEETLDWFDAVAACKSAGMRLLTIENSLEQESLNKMFAYMVKTGSMQRYWTAGNDLNYGRKKVKSNGFTWETNNKAIKYYNWRAGEQHKHNNAFEHCIYLSEEPEYLVNDDGSNGAANIVWADGDCYQKLNYICED